MHWVATATGCRTWTSLPMMAPPRRTTTSDRGRSRAHPRRIPEPATCGVFGAVMLPSGVKARRASIGKIVKSRYVPLMAIGAAFSFLIMMFNVPIPDGTTAHAVGAILIAVVLGPWAAVIAVSIALVIQALFFGDGGVLAIGANCFNMAFVMPFVGYGVYRAARREHVADLAAGGPWRPASAGTWASTPQPCARADRVRAPARAVPHRQRHAALRAVPPLADDPRDDCSPTSPSRALAEFVVTAGVVAYLQRANIPILRLNHANVPVTDEELARKRRLGMAMGAGGASALMASSRRWGCSPPAARSVRTRRSGLNLAKYGLVGCTHRAGQVQRLLEPHAAGRLRVPGRRASRGRVPRVGRRRPGRSSLRSSPCSSWIARALMRRRAADDDGVEPEAGDGAPRDRSRTGRRAHPRVARRERGGAVPVRLHRQAQEAEFVEKTLDGDGQRDAPGDVQRRCLGDRTDSSRRSTRG